MKFYRHGKAVQMSCKTDNPNVARKKLQAEMRKTDDQIVEPRYKKVTVADLFADACLHWTAEGQTDYRDRSKARWENHIKESFGAVRAVQFGTAHLNAYRAKRTAEGAAGATINRELQVVRQAFILGSEAEPPTVRKVPRFKFTVEDNARKGFATPQQLDALRVAAAKDSLEMRALLEIAIVFGWRRGDLLYLRVKDVRLAENSIRLEDSKNGEGREIPMPPSVRTLIEPLVIGRDPMEHLWSGSLSGWKDGWNRVRAAAGCPEMLLHDLRRTSAKTKRAAGVDTSVIMELQGWKTDEVFRRYAIVGIADKVAAFDKQAQYEATLTKVSDNLATVAPETAANEQKLRN